MKSQNKGLMRRICVLAGIALVVAALVLFAFWQCGLTSSQQQAENYVNTIKALIPEPVGTLPEARKNNTMPTLSIDGIDFVGVLEIPRYESSLPVCADWGDISKYPCHFSGSVYDRTLQIGATSQRGQYDFYREISVGDTVFFTDMEGNRYTYSVTNIRHEDNADQTALKREDSALTLFVKNTYDFDYIIIYCNAAS